ncbi:MAG: hypothetical protein MJB14_10220 [Spirochaetes bacterium]|nr:hypothetical protein [Spirochaetota bacterium]
MNFKYIVFLFLFFSFHLFADEVTVPFVSSLRAKVTFGKVQLQWKNPDNFKKHLVIYRSTQPINSTNELKKATQIVTLRNREEYYVDTPPYGTYYYAILIKNRINQKLSIIFIPYRNYITRGIVIKKVDIFRLTSLQVKVQNEALLLNWDYFADTTADKNVMIYRYTLPITDEQRLDEAIIIAKTSIKDKQYLDRTLANIHYYYAIVPEEVPLEGFFPDVNMTIDPAVIPKTVQPIDYFDIDSFVPLPLLAINNDPKSGKPFLDPMILKSPDKKKYQNKTKEIIDQITKKHRDTYQVFQNKKHTELKHLDFQFLEDEGIFINQTDHQAYKNIIQNLRIKEYDKAESGLKLLIEEPLPDQLYYRVSYYLGMLYYHQGNFYHSYLYLIIPYEKYRKQILPYLESISYTIFELLER